MHFLKKSFFSDEIFFLNDYSFYLFFFCSMTETLVSTSNPYEPMNARTAGSVGQAVKGVQVHKKPKRIKKNFLE